jgi:hypothetical protein
MGQLIQIKRSTDNKASTLMLNAGEMAYSTAEPTNPSGEIPLYSAGGTVHNEIWIGKASTSTNPALGEKIFSSDLIHAWDNDKFIMKGEDAGGTVSFGNTTVDSLQSIGAVSGTSGDFGTGAVIGGTGTFSAALQGLNLTVTSGAIGVTAANVDLSLTSDTKKVKLNALVIDGTSNGSSANNALVFDTLTSTFKPGTIDVTASAKAAISAEDDSLNYTDGAFSINTTKETVRTTALIKDSINTVALTAGTADSSLVYNTNSEKWDFTPATQISLSQSNNSIALTLSASGVLKLDADLIVANTADTVASIDDMEPKFAGLLVKPGTVNDYAEFIVGAYTDVNFGTNVLNNVATPTVGHQAATKEYVDSVATGLGVKKPVKASTTANLTGAYVSSAGTITGTGALVVDGVAINTIQVGGSGGSTITVEADRVLVRNQTNANENGIYELTTAGNGSTSFVLTRALSADSLTELAAGTFVFDENKSKGYVISSDFAAGATFGTSGADITWSLFSSAGVIEADDVTTKKVGNEIQVNIDSSGVIESPSTGLNVRIDEDQGLHFVNVGETTVKALAVELDSTSPLVHDTGGIKLGYNNTMNVTSNALGVNAFSNHFTSSTDLRIKLTGGLTSDANGLNVNLDGSGGLVTTSGKIGIKKSSVADNAISVTTDGIHVKLREHDDTSITLANNKFSVKTGGIINDMLAGSIDLTTKVTGLLPKTSGGLGLTTVVSGFLWGNGSAYSAIANGTAGQIMTMGAGGVPEFTTMDGGTF